MAQHIDGDQYKSGVGSEKVGDSRGANLGQPPIKIVWLKGHQSKLAVCSGGYGSSATVTFLEHHTSLLASEIGQARAVWLRNENPNLDLMVDFPQIRKLCTGQDVMRYVAHGGPGDSRRRTPLQAANEIMQQLFPTVPLESIKRYSRKGKTRL
jgi:hypothetical protein